MTDPADAQLARQLGLTVKSIETIRTALLKIAGQIAKTGITLQSRRHSRFTLPTPSRPPCPQSAPPIDARIADMAITTRRHQ